MERPLIQIIIPVYNAGKYLRRCLDSVKNQTFSDWQAILVDDASGDDSYAIISEYAAADDRFLALRHERNSGAAAARNTALAQVSAEYVAFLDADDYWELDMLEILLKKAREGEVDVVQCRFVYDLPNGGIMTPKGAFPDDMSLSGAELKSVYIRMMTGINMNHVCMKLIRASLIRGQRFDTELRTAEDLKFCIMLFRKVKEYRFVNAPLYHYCRNESSLTGRGLPYSEKLKANRSVSKELIRALPDWGIDRFFYRTLSRARPYVIILSKIFRMVQERFASKE